MKHCKNKHRISGVYGSILAPEGEKVKDEGPESGKKAMIFRAVLIKKRMQLCNYYSFFEVFHAACILNLLYYSVIISCHLLILPHTTYRKLQMRIYMKDHNVLLKERGSPPAWGNPPLMGSPPLYSPSGNMDARSAAPPGTAAGCAASAGHSGADGPGQRVRQRLHPSEEINLFFEHRLGETI